MPWTRLLESASDATASAGSSVSQGGVSPPFASSPVKPIMLAENAKLQFRCHRNVKCWNACCSNIDIPLTPYDVLRLKKRLDAGGKIAVVVAQEDAHCQTVSESSAPPLASHSATHFG